MLAHMVNTRWQLKTFDMTWQQTIAIVDTQQISKGTIFGFFVGCLSDNIRPILDISSTMMNMLMEVYGETKDLSSSTNPTTGVIAKRLRRARDIGSNDKPSCRVLVRVYSDFNNRNTCTYWYLLFVNWSSMFLWGLARIDDSSRYSIRGLAVLCSGGWQPR